MVIDLVSIIVTLGIIYKFVGINCFKVIHEWACNSSSYLMHNLLFNFQVYLHIQKEYGVALGLQQAFIIMHLFCGIAVGCAVDFSFDFDWLKHDSKM